jgi:translation initiation factor 6 (eIF-6)
MTNEDFSIGMDLAKHLHSRLTEVCGQAFDLTPTNSIGIGVVCSACIMVINDILEAAELSEVDNDQSLKTIKSYREALANKIIHNPKKSVIVSATETKPMDLTNV